MRIGRLAHAAHARGSIAFAFPILLTKQLPQVDAAWVLVCVCEDYIGASLLFAAPHMSLYLRYSSPCGITSQRAILLC